MTMMIIKNEKKSVVSSCTTTAMMKKLFSLRVELSVEYSMYGFEG
jgi:hypothetical protein